MRFEIDEVPPDIDPEILRTEYYLPRRPVVVRGIAASWPARVRWSVDELEQRIAAAPHLATRQPLWWNVDEALVGDEIQLPALIAHLLRVHQPVRRERSLRVWGTRQGHRTPWHYDGNSIDVFNVQVTGHKRFTLVSPTTPIPCAPFSLLAREPLREPASMLREAHRFTELELSAGDMLFLPRHWFHYVVSLAPQNTNLNWVWTDLASGPDDAPVSRRERELLALLYPLFRAQAALGRLGAVLGPRRVAHFDEAYAREYGGEEGFAVARRFRSSTGAYRLMARAGAELLAPRGEPYPGA